MESELGQGKLSEAERIVSFITRTADGFDTSHLLRRLRNARRDARRARSAPVRRLWLRNSHMQRVVGALSSSAAARIFALQACLSLRVRTLQEMQWRDVSVRRSQEWGTVLDVVIRHEKSPVDQGARIIRGLPVDLSLISPSSVWWGKVLVWLAVEAEGRRERRELSEGVMPEKWRQGENMSIGYHAYLRALREEVAPIAGIAAAEIDTHAARRSGACLHFEEGWSLSTIALVGGWDLGDLRHLLKYIHQSIEVVTMQRQGR